MVLDFTGKITEVLIQHLTPLFSLPPIVAIAIFSTFLSVLILLINRFAVNRKKMKELKDKMAEVRENLSRAQKEKNIEETNKYLNEYMSVNSQFMKQNFKSLMISMVVILLFLPVLGAQYKSDVVAYLPFSLPYVGNDAGWLFWYILVSFTISFVVKKIIGE